MIQVDNLNNLVVDGEDHIRVGRGSKTRMGTVLSMNYVHPFVVPGYGRFVSPAAFVKWLYSGEEKARMSPGFRLDGYMKDYNMLILYPKFFQLFALRKELNEHRELLKLPVAAYRVHPTGIKETDTRSESVNWVMKMVKHILELPIDTSVNSLDYDFSYGRKNIEKEVVIMTTALLNGDIKPLPKKTPPKRATKENVKHGKETVKKDKPRKQKPKPVRREVKPSKEFTEANQAVWGKLNELTTNHDNPTPVLADGELKEHRILTQGSWDINANIAAREVDEDLIQSLEGRLEEHRIVTEGIWDTMLKVDESEVIDLSPKDDEDLIQSLESLLADVEVDEEVIVHDSEGNEIEAREYLLLLKNP